MAILEITRKFAVILLQGYVLIQNDTKGGREKKKIAQYIPLVYHMNGNLCIKLPRLQTKNSI